MIYCVQGVAKIEIRKEILVMKVFNLIYIKHRRQSLEKTLQDVAEPLGMKNASTYLKYENGTYSFKAEQLPALAIALDCDIENFFTEKIAEIAT